MTDQPSTLALTVTAGDASTLQEELHVAEQFLRIHAAAAGHGIMVTQHDYTRYTVAVSADVPYGQTRERRQWDRTAPQ
jgi:hypothetical protein